MGLQMGSKKRFVFFSLLFIGRGGKSTQKLDWYKETTGLTKKRQALRCKLHIRQHTASIPVVLVSMRFSASN